VSEKQTRTQTINSRGWHHLHSHELGKNTPGIEPVTTTVGSEHSTTAPSCILYEEVLFPESQHNMYKHTHTHTLYTQQIDTQHIYSTCVCICELCLYELVVCLSVCVCVCVTTPRPINIVMQNVREPSESKGICSHYRRKKLDDGRDRTQDRWVACRTRTD